MLAETYKRVLLVDGDLHKPRLHDVFNVENKVGLGELLQSEPSPTSANLASAVHQTGVEGLWLLTGGLNVHRTGELIFSGRLPDIFQEMRDDYDAVVVDTPPMLDFADARVFGRLADSVIMVIRSRRTTRAGALTALERLREDGTRVLGTVLNDWDPKETSAVYYVNR
jgi:capsular exopolysaccharide synthesis family protein